MHRISRFDASVRVLMSAVPLSFRRIVQFVITTSFILRPLIRLALLPRRSVAPPSLSLSPHSSFPLFTCERCVYSHRYRSIMYRIYRPLHQLRVFNDALPRSAVSSHGEFRTGKAVRTVFIRPSRRVRRPKRRGSLFWRRMFKVSYS